jgi:hypothetical protein
MSNTRDPDDDDAVVVDDDAVVDPRNPPAQYPDQSTPQEDLPLPEPVPTPLDVDDDV